MRTQSLKSLPGNKRAISAQRQEAFPNPHGASDRHRAAPTFRGHEHLSTAWKWGNMPHQRRSAVGDANQARDAVSEIRSARYTRVSANPTRPDARADVNTIVETVSGAAEAATRRPEPQPSTPGKRPPQARHRHSTRDSGSRQPGEAQRGTRGLRRRAHGYG